MRRNKKKIIDYHVIPPYLELWQTACPWLNWEKGLYSSLDIKGWKG